MIGYISIQRKLREHWLYKEDRVFSKFEAWIDILYEVNHTDNKFLFDGSLVEVKRGSTITSLRKMSEKWKWSITKVNSFLKMLEEDEMLVVKKDTKKTLLTVVNYDFYQSEKCKKRQQSNTEVTQKRQQSNTEVTQKETNNNELIITNNESIITNNEKESKENKCAVALSEFDKALIDFEEFRKKNKKTMTVKAKELLIKKLNELTTNENEMIAILNQSILNGWQGIFPLKKEVSNNNKNNADNKTNESVKNDNDMDTSEIAEILKRRGL